MKRSLVFILVCAFCVALLPVSAFASSVSPPVSMSVVGPAWWSFIKAVGIQSAIDGLSVSQLDDFVSDKISLNIGSNTLEALIGDGLSYDAGEFRLTASVANLFRSWLSDFITDDSISYTPVNVYKVNFASIVQNGVVQTQTLYYAGTTVNNNTGATHVLRIGLDGYYRWTLQEFITGSPASYSYPLSSAKVYYISNANFASYGYAVEQFYWKDDVNASKWSKYNSLPNFYVRDDITSISDGSVQLNLSVPNSFEIPSEFTEPVSIKSSTFEDVSVDDVGDAVYSASVDNSFSAQLEETITRPIVDTIQGLFDGISNFWQELLEWIRSFWSNLTSALSSALSDVVEAVESLFAREDAFISDFLDTLGNLSFVNIWHYVLEWLGSISAFLSLVLTIWGNLPYSFVVIVWASIALTIIFGVYQKFIK